MMTAAKSGERSSGIWSIVFISVISAFLLMTIIQGQEAYAERKKVYGTGKAVSTVSETKIVPGDLPKHTLTFSSRIDMQESPNPDFVGQVIAHHVSDYTAGTGRHWGYRVITHSSGDKAIMAIEGMTKTVAKPKAFPDISFEGKWRYTGGTGRFKGITGRGTYTGKVTKAGLTYDWEGEYEIKP